MNKGENNILEDEGIKKEQSVWGINIIQFVGIKVVFLDMVERWEKFLEN